MDYLFLSEVIIVQDVTFYVVLDDSVRQVNQNCSASRRSSGEPEGSHRQVWLRAGGLSDAEPGADGSQRSKLSGEAPNGAYQPLVVLPAISRVCAWADLHSECRSDQNGWLDAEVTVWL